MQLPPEVNQRGVMQFLLDRGIATRRGVMNAHLEGPYRTAPRIGALRQSEQAQRRGIILPLVPGMPPAMVQEVCDRLALAVRATT